MGVKSVVDYESDEDDDGQIVRIKIEEPWGHSAVSLLVSNNRGQIIQTKISPHEWEVITGRDKLRQQIANYERILQRD